MNQATHQSIWNRIKASIVFYPTLLWNMLLGRWLKVRNWWDPVDDDVILGAMPFKSDVKRLAELGIRGVVNTCVEYAGPVEKYQEFQIKQLRIPTIDFTHPSLDDVEAAVQFMDEQISAGNKVYVHCKAGRARSATVVICWLIKNRQITAEQGQAYLLKHRSHVNSRLTERPVVNQFQEKYLKTGI